MSWIMVGGAAISATPAIIKGIQGFSQKKQGKNILKNLQRPTYEIPEEVKANLTDAQRMVAEGLPEEQKRQFVQNVDRGVTGAMGGMTSRKAGLAGLGDIVQGQNDAFFNLMTADVQAKRENQDKLAAARQAMAGYKDKAFELNKLTPFEDKRMEGQALLGAGMQNINSALDDVGKIGSSLMGGMGGTGSTRVAGGNTGRTKRGSADDAPQTDEWYNQNQTY